MGDAQPLAATFSGACSLNIECQRSRIDFRLRSRYLDEQAVNLDDALAHIARYTAEKKPSPTACRAMRLRCCPSWRAAAAQGSFAPTAPPKPTPPNTPPCVRPQRKVAPCTCRLCWIFKRWVCPRWTAATISARWLLMPRPGARLFFRALCRLTSGRCFVGSWARSAGWPCRETRTTSARPTPK